MGRTWDQDGEGLTLAEADARTSALVLGAARWRLVVGELLERFGRLGGPRVLGFSSIAAYAVERCGVSGRWVEEARALARRVAELPAVRAALVRGDVTWSMAQLLARHATPESEAALVEEARNCTLRGMRRTLEPRATPEADEPAPRRTIETVVDVEDAWAFERAKMIVRAVTDDASEDEVVEAMLGETLSSLLPVPRAEAVMDLAALRGTWRRERQAVDAEVRDRLEAAFEGGLASRPAMPDVEVAEQAVPDDARALDEAIVALCRRLRVRDLAIGDLLVWIDERQEWRGLGHASMAHCVRERWGMSASAARDKMALARRCTELPALRAALSDGRLGVVGARMIGRVASQATVDAWVARAEERTVVHLREDIEVAGLLARTSGDAGWLAPPDDEPVEAVRDVERRVLGGESDGSAEAGAVVEQMSVATGLAVEKTARTGRVALRLGLDAEVADLWSAVHDLHVRSGEPGSFVAALARNIMRHWTPPPSRIDARPFAEVYRRDRYRCQSPTCGRRGELGAHHVVFRAHGGGDEPCNLVSLCGKCHVGAVHGGHLKVVGVASDGLRWEAAGFRVVGRERQRVA